MVRTISLNTKLVTGCMLMLAFSLMLSASLLFMYGNYYLRTSRDVMLLTMFKQVLVAASDISSERSPINILLGLEPETESDARRELQTLRQASNAALDMITQPVTDGVSLSQDQDLVAAIDRVRKALVIGRADIDALIALPRAQRSADKIMQGMRDMFLAADLVRPIAVGAIAKISAEDESLAGPAMTAQMLGELRDYSGRLIAQMIPFVSTRVPLPDAFVFDLVRTRERILEVWQLAGRQGGLYAGDRHLGILRQQINARFFGQGLQIIDRAATTGRMTGAFGISAEELGERYLPTLEPIEQLRTGFLDAALNKVSEERFSALVWLVAMSITAGLLIAATSVLIVAGRYYVLQPLMMASDHIVNLSNGEAIGELVSPTNSREMLRLFDALEGLRIILSEREQHTERLKVLSETDGLTGLINRRLFDRIGHGDPEFDEMSPDVSVIMMDLDRFKGINDTYGHLAGDQVLKHAAAIVQRVCRRSDLAARYGGEEISIIVFEPDEWVAMNVAERIRAELEAKPVITPDGRRISVTASFGVAHGKRAGANWLTMVKAADAALYEAKASGRNRVCRAGGALIGANKSVA